MPESIEAKYSSSETAAILRRRAAELALAREEATAPSEGSLVLDFVLAGDTYAIPVTSLREIAPLRKLGSIPGTPEFVHGVVVIRGQVVSVLDLRILLGLSPSRVEATGCAIILSDGTMSFALYADQIGDIHFLADADLKAGEPSLERLERRYIAGITRERVILLDGVKLLSDPKLVVND